MVKKMFVKFLMVGVFLATSLYGGESYIENDSYSLVGFEYGAGSFDITSDGAPAVDESIAAQTGSFKIGAQTDEYRLFLSARYYGADELESMSSFGVDFEYLFNFSSYVNFFVGIGAGQIDIEIKDTLGQTRSVSDSYVSGDAGFNAHVTKDIDFELGVRSLGFDITHTLGGVTYRFQDMTSGYASIIFKYQMD